MVEGIEFYAQYKSRVLMIPCKADDFILFIGLSVYHHTIQPLGKSVCVKIGYLMAENTIE